MAVLEQIVGGFSAVGAIVGLLSSALFLFWGVVLDLWQLDFQQIVLDFQVVFDFLLDLDAVEAILLLDDLVGQSAVFLLNTLLDLFLVGGVDPIFLWDLRQLIELPPLV